MRESNGRCVAQEILVSLAVAGPKASYLSDRKGPCRGPGQYGVIGGAVRDKAGAVAGATVTATSCTDGRAGNGVERAVRLLYSGGHSSECPFFCSGVHGSNKKVERQIGNRTALSRARANLLQSTIVARNDTKDEVPSHHSNLTF